ncbi:hypothetical protein CP980_16230 [Streptomyces vinaceus]|uniref:Uncharacterized protein n=1 Tax=Streptomyces vinaceus TaxID=1960 RepID=A0A5J6J8G7_STRVI|nr:hypothetical protein [Streptomyces vinaceus]QEV46443.1 hypothetical protein CP980_16230 [Streptomyces vinaceus]GHE76950.1 hypothetical protein GCM10017778_73400 [Streptomyces vinaceus]
MDRAALPPRRICPNCDGHASVAVTLGGRDRAGHLRTITAHCPACHGTGLRLVRTTAAGVRV